MEVYKDRNGNAVSEVNEMSRHTKKEKEKEKDCSLIT